MRLWVSAYSVIVTLDVVEKDKKWCLRDVQYCLLYFIPVRLLSPIIIVERKYVATVPQLVTEDDFHIVFPPIISFLCGSFHSHFFSL
jgi:hypothetical protein